MAGLGDFRLKPNERWIVSNGNTLQKVPFKKQSTFSKFTEWATGVGRLANILKVVAHKAAKMNIDSRKDVEALVALRKSVELCYSRRSGFSEWFDHTLRHDHVKVQKEQVINAIYEKIRSHFFGPDQPALVEMTGEWQKRDRHALDTVYNVLTAHDPSAKEIQELDQIVSILQPAVNERKVWYTEMANLGYATAYYCLGKLYERGVGGDFIAHPENALKYYQEAAKNGSIPALLRLGKAYRYGNSSLGITLDKAQAHQWAIKASAKNDEAALQVCLDLLEGFGIAKNPELAQEKLIKLIDNGHPEYQAKAAYHAAENAFDDENAQQILVDALKGLGVTIDEEANLCHAKCELARYLETLGDASFASLVYSKAIEAGLESIKSGDAEAALWLVKIDRDRPELLATVPEKIKMNYRELGLPALLAGGTKKVKETLQWIADKWKGAPLGADLAVGVSELTLNDVYEAFSNLSEEQQTSIASLVRIAETLHPLEKPLESDIQLLAGALFGTSKPNDTLIAIATLLTEGGMEPPEQS